MAPELRLDDVILRYTAERYAALVRQAKGADLLIRDVRAFFDGTDAPLGQAAREWLAGNALHTSPSPSISGDTRAESGAEVPASVKGGRWLPCLRGSPELPPCETYEAACAAIEASPLAHKPGWTVRDTAGTWDRSGCRETVCYCHDEASTPRFCGHCGCRSKAQETPIPS